VKDLGFVYPTLLWLAGAVPLLVLAIHLLERRRQRVLMERLGELPAVQRMMAARSPRRRALKAVLLGLGLGLVVVAAARPQRPGDGRAGRPSMDLVIAIDVSKSMMVGDVEVAEPSGGWPASLAEEAPRPVPADPRWVQGTRLERARQVVGELVDRLATDRVAIVLYAGAAIHFPLTDDGALAVQLAHLVGPSDLIGGSDVGEALRVGTCLLRGDLDDAAVGCHGVGRRGRGGDPLPGEEGARGRPAEEREEGERGKAILVISDGGVARETVLEEVDRAQQLGVSLFFVGVGSPEGGVVPELGWDGRVLGPKRMGSDVVRSRLDSDALRGLAELAGGAAHYLELPARGPFDVTPIAAALARVPRGVLTPAGEARPRDVYEWPLFAGMMLLVIEAAIGLRRRVRHPEAPP
jgi:Ca-activated chloride channel homolog